MSSQENYDNVKKYIVEIKLTMLKNLWTIFYKSY